MTELRTWRFQEHSQSWSILTENAEGIVRLSFLGGWFYEIIYLEERQWLTNIDPIYDLNRAKQQVEGILGINNEEI